MILLCISRGKINFLVKIESTKVAWKHINKACREHTGWILHWYSLFVFPFPEKSIRISTSEHGEVVCLSLSSFKYLEYFLHENWKLSDIPGNFMKKVLVMEETFLWWEPSCAEIAGKPMKNNFNYEFWSESTSFEHESVLVATFLLQLKILKAKILLKIWIALNVLFLCQRHLHKFNSIQDTSSEKSSFILMLSLDNF